jgi:hypothetical protein
MLPWVVATMGVTAAAPGPRLLAGRPGKGKKREPLGRTREPGKPGSAGVGRPRRQAMAGRRWRRRVAAGEIEGLGGGGLGLAGLAEADEGESFLGGVQEAGLGGVRGEAEMGGDPGGGGRSGWVQRSGVPGWERGLTVAVLRARGRHFWGVSGSVDKGNLEEGA